MSLGLDGDTLWKLLYVAALSLVVYVAKLVRDFAVAYRKASSVGSNIPGPTSRFPFGMMEAMGEDPLLTHFVERHGDKEEGIARCQCLSMPTFVVQNHEHLKLMFSHMTHHSSSAGDFFGYSKATNVMRWFLGNSSILYTDWDEHSLWVRLRRVMARPFLQVNIQKQVHQVSLVQDRLRTYIKNKIGDQSSVTLDVEPLFNSFTMDVLGEAVFSQDFQAIKSLDGGRKQRALEAFNSFFEESSWRDALTTIMRPWTQVRFLWVPTPSNIRLKRARATLWDEVSNIVSQRRKTLRESPDAEFHDFLQHMIAAKDEVSGFRLSDTELRDNLMTILFAGHDTTSINLTFLMYAVAKHPEVQRKVAEEADALLPSGAVGPSTYGELSYAKLVVRESLRMFPSLPVGLRTLDTEVKLTEKYTLPKNSFILLPIHAAMRSEHNWENANSFIPERHMKNDAPFHAFMPFLHGQRNCIGMRFAELELALSLVYLCRHFEFSLPNDYEMEFKYALPMLRPLHGMPLIIKERASRVI